MDDVLLYASTKGLYEEAEKALAGGARVNGKAGSDWTPLSLASQGGYIEIVKLLLSHGADVNQMDNMGLTPLAAASGKGQKPVAELLLKKGANINFIPRRPKSPPYYYYGPPLVEAAKENRLELVSFLLAKGADVNIRGEGGKYGSTPLGTAALRGFGSVTELLLKSKAEVDAKQSDGVTPLIYSAQKGFADVAHLLINAGADPNSTDLNGNTPLILAAEGGYGDIVKLLIARKADFKAFGEFGKTALSAAAATGHTNIMALLLQAGADPNTPLGKQSGTGGMALHVAARQGWREAVALLLEYKADVNARDRDGSTPLIRASDVYNREEQEGRIEVAEVLISKGADINAVNHSGMSALIFASMRRFEQMAELLVRKGADINIQDSYRFSAIHYAGCSERITAALLSAGADPDTRHSLETPLMSAAGRCHQTKVLEVLINAGADVNGEGEFGRTPLDYAEDAGLSYNAALLRAKGGKIGASKGKGIEILSPKSGDTFMEGNTVTLTVAPSTNTPKLRFVGIGDEIFLRKGSSCNRGFLNDRYTCKFVIPKGSARWLTISIMGQTVDGGVVSHYLRIAVKKPPAVHLQELSVSVNNSMGEIFLSHSEDTAPIYVGGIYSDGSKQEIAHSAWGTTYETSDPGVAIVDSEGTVSAVSSGKARITVRNSGKTATVWVTVKIKQNRVR